MYKPQIWDLMHLLVKYNIMLNDVRGPLLYSPIFST